ncbi:MAG: SRPBCC family protein [Gammaproteobacteria bacterium]|nr:SRPBCC family protein [Gammaproteobacteria bacterium]
MKVFRIVMWFTVLILFAGLFLPQDYRLMRSQTILATPQAVHQLVGDLNQWPRWSPWLELEPSVQVTLGSQQTGVGASQHWTDDSGGGRLSFIASSPSTGIIYNLWFGENKMPAISHLNYIVLSSQMVRIEWTLEGEVQLPIIGFYLAQAMDWLIGPAFELGLANLKREVEN